MALKMPFLMKILRGCYQLIIKKRDKYLIFSILNISIKQNV